MGTPPVWSQDAGYSEAGSKKGNTFCRSCRLAACLLFLVGKPCSALCTSSCKNLATVSCGHSLHKAVFFFSVQLFGLICSFHVFLLLLDVYGFRHKTPIALIILHFSVSCQDVLGNFFDLLHITCFKAFLLTKFVICSIIFPLSASKMRSNPTRREVELMAYIVTIIMSVAVNVISHFICKWLDKASSDNQHKSK